MSSNHVPGGFAISMSKRWIVVTSLVVLTLLGVTVLFLSHDGPDLILTLASLRRVDDLPLYVMHDYRDYEDLLQQGIESAVLPRSQEWACTCFAALGESGDRLFGRNFDWTGRAALVLFTDPPDGYASVSLVDLAFLGYDNPTEIGWHERWALLDAPYWPLDGMNEAGLAVGVLAVPHAEPPRDSRQVSVGTLHAIRLMLDHAADVEEAISLLGRVQLVFEGGPPVHYMVADAAGRSAVLEFVGGQMMVARNDEPWQVATNFVIAEESPEDAHSSCWRYNRVYETLEQAGGTIPHEEAMAVLQQVSQTGAYHTMWSAVYDLARGDVLVALDREYGTFHEFSLELMVDR